MKRQALSDLAELSQALQDADAARLNALKTEEQRIRGQLAALDQTHASTRDLPASDTLPQQRVGGDILWQMWVGRRRRELQIQLAGNLARQGSARRALRKSFGKRSALDKINTQKQASADHGEKVKAFDRLTSMGLLQRRG